MVVPLPGMLLFLSTPGPWGVLGWPSPVCLGPLIPAVCQPGPGEASQLCGLGLGGRDGTDNNKNLVVATTKVLD